MNRRQVLALATSGIGSLAGCSGGSGPQSDELENHVDTPSKSDESQADTAGKNQAGTAGKNEPDRLVVRAEGSDDNPGIDDAALGSIQEALDRAEPGTTIELRPGVHRTGDPERPVGITRRAGRPGDPITITGPPDAIVRGPVTEMSGKPLFHITHSHVHLTGMTLDGLTKPQKPDSSHWYRPTLVKCSPPTWQDTYPDYLTDVVIEPRAAGNARSKLISSYRTNDLTIGGFEVVGPAGVDWHIGDRMGYALGAVVSLGRSANNFGTSHYPWDDPDQSHGIRVHHIANTEGHWHTELVKLHSGNFDVTVEYCTDTGGCTRSGVRLDAARSTVRWSEFERCDRHGVVVFVPPMKKRGVYESFREIPDERFPGRDNAIYGNRFSNNEKGGIGFSSPDWFQGGPDGQRFICGNTMDTNVDDGPTKECPDEVPAGDGIGYCGGDGPWT